MSTPCNPARRQFLRQAASLATSAAAAVSSASLVAAPPAGGWRKSSRNPILSLGEPGQFDHHNILSPAIARRGDQHYLFYSGGPVGPRTGDGYVRYQLGLALSADGQQFKKLGRPLLPLGQRDNFHVTPALLRDPGGELLTPEGRWYMVYCGNRADDVELATSDDGLHWRKDPRSPIYRAAYAPNLVQAGDQLRMYYVHKPPGGRPWEIHLATADDWTGFRPHPANPMLTLSQPWESSNLFYPYVLREGDAWILFYAAYWKNPPSGKQSTAIGMARSDDGLHWTKHPANPVLTPSPDSPYDSQYTSSQSVLRVGDEYRMYYAGRVDLVHKYFSINLATHPAPLLSD